MFVAELDSFGTGPNVFHVLLVAVNVLSNLGYVILLVQTDFKILCQVLQTLDANHALHIAKLVLLVYVPFVEITTC